MFQLKLILIVSMSVFFLGCANREISQNKSMQTLLSSSIKTSENSRFKKNPKISLVFEGKGEKRYYPGHNTEFSSRCRS